MKNTLDTKTALTILGIILAGVVAFYSSRLAVANEFSSIRIDATELKGRVETNMQSIADIKKQYETLNAKVDVLLIDRGYNPNKIVSEAIQ